MKCYIRRPPVVLFTYLRVLGILFIKTTRLYYSNHKHPHPPAKRPTHPAHAEKFNRFSPSDYTTDAT